MGSVLSTASQHITEEKILDLRLYISSSGITLSGLIHQK